MKTLKKALSAVLAAAMALSMVTSAAFAAAGDAAKIGFNVKDSNVAKQIFVKDDSLWVFPHPWNASQYITNYTLYANKIESTNGYTLRVTDENKKQIIDQTEVNKPVADGSFVRAVKDSETIYIPIVEQAEENTGINQGFFSGYVPNNAYLNKDVKGVFGRNFDEAAAVFTVPANAENQAGSRMEYNIAGTLTETTAPITVEISFYFDGNAGAAVYMNGGAVLMSVDKDGKCSYQFHGGAGDAAIKDLGITLESGKWHRFAVSIDKAKGDWSTVWVDGKMANGVGSGWGSLPTQLRFGLTSDCGEGHVAYADPRAYYGYYNNAYDSVRVKSTLGDAIVDTAAKTVKYNSVNIDNAEALSAAVLAATNAREVKIYTDDTKTALGYTENSVAEIVSKSMASREIYTLESTATPMQKIGLEILGTYETGFSWVGNVNQRTNIYVKKDEDKLYVFSSPLNEYTAYAYRVLKSLKSARGYELSIVDKDKNEISGLVMKEDNSGPLAGTRDKDIVTKGCFLKGVKGDDVVYIPIDNKIELVNSSDLSTLGGHNWQTDVVNVSNDGKIAGKEENDVAYVMIPKNTTTKLAKLQLDSDDLTQYYSGGNYTYSLNVYADGDTTARIIPVIGSGFADAFNWAPDGKFTYVGNNMVAMDGGTAERGKWHRVAITFDTQRGRLHFWVDGKLITTTSAYLSSLSRLDLGIETGSSNGKVAYDDLRIYEGYYDADEDMVEVTSQNTSAYGGAISYTDEIPNVDALKADMGIDNISLYTDNTLAAKTENLSEAKYAMVLSESGVGYNYFNVAKVDKANMLVSKEENGTFTARALYKVPEGTDITIATYNKQTGKLETVKQYETGSDGIAELTKTMSDTTYQKAFLWDSQLKPIAAATQSGN